MAICLMNEIQADFSSSMGTGFDAVLRIFGFLGTSSSPSSSSSSSSSNKTFKREEPSVIKNVKQNTGEISIRPNKFGNFEHLTTGLVFSRDKIVIGRQSITGENTPLTTEDIELCKQYKFNYKLPENLNVNKSLDDVSIEEVEEEEELDDEDIDEDIEEDLELDDE